MPLQKCGESGWKYGESGKCYDTKKEAIQQMVAINLDKELRGEQPEWDSEAKIVADSIKRCRIGDKWGWRSSPDGQCFENKEDAISDGIQRRRERADLFKELGDFFESELKKNGFNG